MSGLDDRWSAAATQRGLQDFFALYHRCSMSANPEIEAELQAHPALGPVFRSLTVEQIEHQRAQSKERMLRVEAGDWSSYREHLQQQGAFYAQAGVRFSDWCDLIRVMQRKITPALIAELRSEPQRLAEALDAMALFYDRAIAEIGESFVRAKEAALRREQEKLSATIASLHEAVVISDLEGKVILRNPASLALSQQSSIERLNDPRLRGRFYVEHSDVALELAELPLARALRGETIRDEVLVCHFEGRPSLTLSINAAPLATADGVRFGAVASYRDISMQRELESERLRAAQIEAASRQIAETSRLKSEFLANMSHELRTPLNSIIGFAELLLDGEAGPLEPQPHEFVGDILKSGRHLQQLINDVLDLSKVEAGRMDFYAEQTSLRAAIEEVRTLLRTVSAQAQVAIDIDVDPAVDHVVLDPSRLKQVLYNFVSNALKFTRAGGHVTVRTRARGASEFCVEVEDTGIGISPEDQDKLFVEFQQLRTGAAKPHGGTGLGLALTRRLVEAQGGSVGVRSALGRGSTFFAILPRNGARAGERPSIPHRTPAPSDSARSVLVVEDDPTDARSIVETLESAGFATALAHSGAQALELLATRSFDAVTLDLLLPDMCGLEVLRRIRTETPRGAVPVLVISVVTEHVSSGFVVDDVLVKPIRPRELLDALRRTGVSSRSDGVVLVVDDDPSSLRLMAAALERAEHPHECSSSPERALSLVREGSVDIVAVILDLQMPTMDGFAFLRALRADPRGALVPVLVWSVVDLDAAQTAELATLAQRVVRKDGATTTLVRELEPYLQRRRAPTLPERNA